MQIWESLRFREKIEDEPQSKLHHFQDPFPGVLPSTLILTPHLPGGNEPPKIWSILQCV